MGFFTNLEHSVENGVADIGHGISDVASTIGHDVVNSARVGETLAEGAWDYAIQNPGEIAKTVAIAAGTGLAIGAATVFFPECAILGASLTVAGAVAGGVGLTAMGIQTYDSFKQAAPDLEIIWDADHHSKAQVDAAENAVKQSTGGAMANLALVLPTFWLGNVAGNLGADASKAMFAVGDAPTIAAAATASGDAAAGGVPTVAAASSVDSSTAVQAASMSNATAAAGDSASTAAAGDAAKPGFDLWSYLNHNPLQNRTDLWTRVNNNNAYAFEANYWLAKSDLMAVASLGRRLAPEVSVATSPSRDSTTYGAIASRSHI